MDVGDERAQVRPGLRLRPVSMRKSGVNGDHPKLPRHLLAGQAPSAGSSP